ncbi:hypothetical protein HMPREF0731_3116 [Pseudoroseomonas cervicalis ATCC 49957]|uniref:Uncharacterized protein n=1 Tax=Pseudoroseomonas cervicalis ATCC 49957 TaxID=525371 RepID=D5RPV4_9PROT|nr:hypothetical protein HMPREF0731_3116 [Pseudoroseomonas cervicalis ATCC 49957]
MTIPASRPGRRKAEAPWRLTGTAPVHRGQDRLRLTGCGAAFGSWSEVQVALRSSGGSTLLDLGEGGTRSPSRACLPAC